MRVLLADDDMILAQSLTDRLEGQGFHFDEADVEARLSCLRSGADNYLTNPFNMEEFGRPLARFGTPRQWPRQ
jgi:DNA-binding response OmpR family regulator